MLKLTSSSQFQFSSSLSRFLIITNETLIHSLIFSTNIWNSKDSFFMFWNNECILQKVTRLCIWKKKACIIWTIFRYCELTEEDIENLLRGFPSLYQLTDFTGFPVYEQVNVAGRPNSTVCTAGSTWAFKGAEKRERESSAWIIKKYS